MIDPVNITSYDQTEEHLQQVLLFWILAAGKNAITSARCLDNLLRELHSCQQLVLYQPFKAICSFGCLHLAETMKKHGIGCYNHKARSFWEIANSGFNLRTCSLQELESIHGIGFKTSRCFLIHSRRDARCAGLDTHILRFLSDKGYEVPSATPTKKEYLRIEKIFLDLVDQAQVSVAQYDLDIWREYSGRSVGKSNKD